MTLRRRTGLRPMSAKQQRFSVEFEKAKAVVLARSKGRCEAQTSVCRGFGQHVHHALGRVGPTVNEPRHLLHVCDWCHRYIHLHPLESYKNGWLLSRIAPTRLHGSTSSDDESGDAHGATGEPWTGAGSAPPSGRRTTETRVVALDQIDREAT